VKTIKAKIHHPEECKPFSVNPGAVKPLHRYHCDVRLCKSLNAGRWKNENEPLVQAQVFAFLAFDLTTSA
jgi:hypothetical protein